MMKLDVAWLAAWIKAIPFDLWPQQDRLDDGQIRPAMVTDLSWHGFGRATDAVVRECLQHFPGCTDRERMLSVVMPGHKIPPHVDRQGERWVCRLHVPLRTSLHAVFVVDDVAYRMEVGQVYRVDTTRPHAVYNGGQTPRVHFMFDCVVRA